MQSYFYNIQKSGLWAVAFAAYHFTV